MNRFITGGAQAVLAPIRLMLDEWLFSKDIAFFAKFPSISAMGRLQHLILGNNHQHDHEAEPEKMMLAFEAGFDHPNSALNE